MTLATGRIRVLNERNMRRAVNAQLRASGYRCERTFRSLDRALSYARRVRLHGHAARVYWFGATNAATVWTARGAYALYVNDQHYTQGKGSAK